MSADIVTVERVIPAEPKAIFDLLADPAGQQRIDGSGSLQGSRSGSRRLKLGDSFGMDMKIGLPYKVRNVVTEFEDDRRIAWQVRAKGFVGKLFTGRTWRYELEPIDGGTRVRETWDNTTEAAPARPFTRRMGSKNKAGMTTTLARIEQVLREDGNTTA